STTGRNVVRVRATVEGVAIGDGVWFRSLDVDDPSDAAYTGDFRQVIDPNDRGNDNRGRLANVHEPGISFEPKANVQSLAGSGQLRTVGASNALGAWSAAGKAVKAIVKPLTNPAGQWIDANDNVVANAAEAQRVAEVDLATTFAPGDNFRVAAHIHPTGRDNAEFEKLMNELIDPDKVPAKGAPTGLGPNIRFTPQLAVWRYLNIEDDSVAGMNIRTLMSEATTNRQDNRFADGFMEPRYIPAANNPTPLPARAATETLGTVSAGDQGVIDAARDTKSIESDVFWVVYVGSGWTNVIESRLGITANPNAADPWDWTIMFDANITKLFPAGAPTAAAKIAVHEVGHQLLRNSHNGLDGNGHRGTPGDVVRYYNAASARKTDPKLEWDDKVSIMNYEAVLVPMANGAATIRVGEVVGGVRAVAGNNAGPLDKFYFNAQDIAFMRRRTESPGK
ncbi:MAG: hypothetical protein L0211_17370, partial [Planctomycetaceae bacterium]|nr:hypothetical protein [Planctomycetaceae bacterium]